VLGDTITRLEQRGITVMLSGIDPRHADILAALGIGDHLLALGLVHPDTPSAIAHARTLLGVPPHRPVAAAQQTEG
jgi:SulP family sulfate permease